MTSKRLLALAVFVCGAAASLSGAHAQSGAEANAWAAWCESQNGTVQITSSNPICIPGPSSGGGSVYSADEEVMLNLAGQFGSALGAAIRQSFANAARQEQINRMQEAWEREQAVRQAAADLERQRQRNETLLASMHGAIGASELGRTQLGTETLQMRTADQMFGTGGEDRGVTTQEVPVSAPLDLTEMRAAQEAYFAALDDMNEIEGEIRRKQTHIEIMAGLRREMELRLDQQRALAQLTPLGTPQRQDAEASVARLQDLVADAAQIDAEDAQELAEMEQEAVEARAALRAAGERGHAPAQAQ